MGRPQSVSSSVLIRYVDLLYQQKNGNLSALTFAGLSALASEYGQEISADVFRKNQAVRERISRLKEMEKTQKNDRADIALTLDVNQLLGGCSCERTAVLREKLTLYDASWHETFSDLAGLKKKNTDLRIELEKEKLFSSELKARLESLTAESDKERKKVKRLLKLFERFVCREAAASLISREIPDLKAADYLNEQAVKELTRPVLPVSDEPDSSAGIDDDLAALSEHYEGDDDDND